MCMGNKAEGVLAVVIGVLALWPNLVGASWAKWIVVVAAILLLLDACRGCMKGKAAVAKKKGRR